MDETYMRRCLQLASYGRGHVSPNPMVGAVVVCDGRIIGEGYHQQCGKAHAEVNAIASVKDKSLLAKSTLYVSLEPCSHYGKTPPCAKLIIESKIPNVVVACLDPFDEVSGRGVKMLQEVGINVRIGILEQEALELNKEFITTNIKGRPYIYLKWAQSSDGFIDGERIDEKCEPIILSNQFTKLLVHKLRAETDAIMVGTNTAIKDNPSLTTRYWYGTNPLRVVLDKSLRVSQAAKIYDNETDTLIYTESKEIKEQDKVSFVNVSFDTSLLESIMTDLKAKGISSILIEGGAQLLQSFIDSNLWDEAFVEISDSKLKAGVKAPLLRNIIKSEYKWYSSLHRHLVNS